MFCQVLLPIARIRAWARHALNAHLRTSPCATKPAPLSVCPPSQSHWQPGAKRPSISLKSTQSARTSLPPRNGVRLTHPTEVSNPACMFRQVRAGSKSELRPSGVTPEERQSRVCKDRRFIHVLRSKANPDTAFVAGFLGDIAASCLKTFCLYV